VKAAPACSNEDVSQERRAGNRSRSGALPPDLVSAISVMLDDPKSVTMAGRSHPRAACFVMRRWRAGLARGGRQLPPDRGAIFRLRGDSSRCALQ
jgi:hypothetical protein